MYCSTCATPLAPGLSYCNRCGVSLKEREDSESGSVNSYLTTITMVGLGGLGLMLGGAIALKNGAEFQEELIGVFMTMVFFIVSLVELFLCRQLSRVIKSQTTAAPPSEITKDLRGTAELRGANDFRLPEPRTLPEPIPSVTENTTRTLDYSRNE